MNTGRASVESRPPFAPVDLENRARLEGWRELVRIDDEDVQVRVMSVDGHPAHLTKGRVHYLAGRPDAAMADLVVGAAVADCGIVPLDLPPDIRVQDNGDLRYVFTYGPEAVYVSDLVDDGEIVLGEAALPSCGVMAVRRR